MKTINFNVLPRGKFAFRPATTEKPVFPKKYLPLVEEFEQTITELESRGEIDFTLNHHQNGIKAGGSMLRGSKVLEVYTSFRDHRRDCAAIGLAQDSENSKPYVITRRYRAYSGLPEIVHRFSLPALQTAAEEFYRSVKDMA